MEIPENRPKEPSKPIDYKTSQSSKVPQGSEGFVLPEKSGILKKANVVANIKKLNDLGKLPRVLQLSVESVTKQEGKIGPFVEGNISGPTSDVMRRLFERVIQEKGEGDVGK